MFHASTQTGEEKRQPPEEKRTENEGREERQTIARWKRREAKRKTRQRGERGREERGKQPPNRHEEMTRREGE
jgi:hypothetical protein